MPGSRAPYIAHYPSPQPSPRKLALASLHLSVPASASECGWRGSPLAAVERESLLAWPGPLFEPAGRFAHIFKGSSIAEADEVPPFSLVEIDPRRGCNANLVQHSPHKAFAVAGQVRDIGVKIECAVRWRELAEACVRQLIEQHLPVPGIGGLIRFEFFRGVKSSQRAKLRNCRRRDVEVLSETLENADQPLRHHHPAHAPSGHRIVFREAVYDDGFVPE